MISEEEFVALLEYVEAKCKEIVSTSLGRDALIEAVNSREAEEALRKIVLDL